MNADKNKTMEDFEDQKGKMARAHNLELVALKEKNYVEKNAMKKEHSEYMERHKAAIEQQKNTIEDVEKN